jgi:hypothetical protein
MNLFKEQGVKDYAGAGVAGSRSSISGRISPHQQSRDDLQMTAEIHQEIHSEFKTKDPHVEGKGPVDPPLVGAEVSIGMVDHADPELAQNPDAALATKTLWH